MLACVSVGKRSPILGYNHNVRYRGLVFHVQTEDSGVLAPHVFTHLFYEGVILSTRKLVYDAGASEDVIRSLMQAQHKATLKELRRGQYDDKIDEYLGGNPGLLPRGAGAGDEDVAVDEEKSEAARELSAKVSELEASLESRAVTRNPAVTSSSPAISLPPMPGPRAATGPLPSPSAFTGIPGADEARPSRAQTSENGRLAASLPPLPTPPQPGRGTGTAPRMSAMSAPRPAITSPVVVARDLTEQTNSGKVMTIPDSSEIYSPAPASAETPPGMLPDADHPGVYSSVRRSGGPVEPAPPTRPSQWERPGSSAETAAGARPLAARPPTGAPVAGGAPTGPRPMPRSPTPVPMTPRNRGAGGVVMSRPAVIVGAPRTNPPPVKPRAAGDEERRGFGQGLISEKSLDEVILAYLSEDANDE